MSGSRTRRRARPLILLAAALAGAPVAAAAQAPDTVEVVAGPRYAAGPLQERLLGREYRELWTTPIRVPVLDLGRFAGGLTPVERGGGMQTRSLRLRGENGREYNFRSVDKHVSRGLPAELRGTVVDRLIQDQISSLHPAAAVIATGLLDALGILNPGPRLVLMPDDPRLGEFRDDFAGVLGTIEIQANEAPDGSPDFAGAAEVDGADDVLAAVLESPADRIDARAYLRERLASLVMADWDRHADQFRWARFDSAGVHRWVPVPEDRDYAFSNYDGLLLRFVGPVFPEAGQFSEHYRSDLLGLTQNSAELDRHLLAGLEWPEWERAVAWLQRELTDEEIAAAVARMPPEYQPRSAPELIRILRARRDGLGPEARRFYLQLAREPEIHATEAPDRAEVERLPDGSLRVTLAAADSTGAEPYFRRTFLPGETKEVWIYLHGGDDAATVRGEAASSPLVRVIGGAGADSLRDLSRVSGPGERTAFHDAEGENAVRAGAETVVDRAPYEEPVWVPGDTLPPREWGATRSWFAPWAGYSITQGLMVGGGPSWTWYGFRRFPQAGRLRLRGMYGVPTGDVGLDAVAEFLGVGRAPDVRVHARGSGLEDFRYHGLGNDSPAGDAVAGEVIDVDQWLLEARLRYRISEGTTLGVGPVLERLDAHPDAAALPRLPAGTTEAYGKAGLAAGLEMESRPEREVGERGLVLRVDGRLFPAAWDLDSAFGRVSAEARGYAPLPARFVLAVRAGAAQLWGEAPLLDRLSLGGDESLRGFARQRFTGDALVYGSLELRSALTRAKLLVRGDLGVLAFVDAGRVYEDGVSEGGWHRGYGAGVWFESLGYAVSASYAHGEDDRLYLRLGMPF